MIRARVRPITTIWAKAAARRACCSTRTSVFAAEAVAVAMVTMAKPAINSIYKATEAVRRAPGRPSDPARASLVASSAIRPRSA
jgi:hypothetical protein